MSSTGTCINVRALLSCAAYEATMEPKGPGRTWDGGADRPRCSVRVARIVRQSILTARSPKEQGTHNQPPVDTGGLIAKGTGKREPGTGNAHQPPVDTGGLIAKVLVCSQLAVAAATRGLPLEYRVRRDRDKPRGKKAFLRARIHTQPDTGPHMHT